MLQAKPVIPNQYWILRDDHGKVGNIEATDSGVQIRIRNQVETFKNLSVLKRRVKIDFESLPKVAVKRQNDHQVNGYPTTGTAHNAIFDVKHQVPLWTREPRSKSWYAAGWYAVRHGRRWQVVECPKLIALERYEYRGPFHNKQEAEHAVAYQ
jgi:hypothetical protein